MPMSNELKALAEKLTKALSPEFDKDEIAEIIQWAWTLLKLRKIQHEVDNLYAPPSSEDEAKAVL